LALSAKEFTMLIALAMRPNEIVTRPDLIGAASSTSNIVDVQISRLRDKLGAHRWMIETVRGRGYRFRTNPPLGS